MKKIIVLCGLGIFLILAGCASHPTYKPLQESVSERIKESHIIHGSVQKDIYAEYEVSSAGAASGVMFGALGALIGSAVDAGVNSSRAEAAEERVKPLKDLTSNFNFEEKLQKSLNLHFNDTKWNQQEITLITDGKDESFDKAVSDSELQTSLVISTQYALTPDFNAIKLSAHINLFPNTEPLKQIQKELYKDSDINNPKAALTSVKNSLFRDQIFLFIKTSRAPISIEEATKILSQNQGQLLKDTLTKATDLLPKVIRHSLQKNITSDSAPSEVKQDIPTDIIEIDGYEFEISRNTFGLSLTLL